jgi:hypothetical protein
MSKLLGSLTCLVLAASGLAGCSSSNPNINPRADEVLRRMSDTLAKAQNFKLHSVATIENRLETGQLAQFTRDSSFVISRPDRMYAAVRKGPESNQLWYQGKELTLLDVKRNLYATIKTPDRIGAMLDFMAEKEGVVLPLADLLYPNPYKVLTERVQTGDYVDQQEIDNRMCHHLLFTQENVDWQIWIDAGDKAVPRRLVITYKNDPGQPQFEAILDEWGLASPNDLMQLVPKVPSTARRVEIAELLNPGEGGKP